MRRARPRSLRRLMTFRPPWVAMRAINPSLRWRGMRFGCQVRFMRSFSHYVGTVDNCRGDVQHGTSPATSWLVFAKVYTTRPSLSAQLSGALRTFGNGFALDLSMIRTITLTCRSKTGTNGEFLLTRSLYRERRLSPLMRTFLSTSTASSI